ncbi:MAG: hypothetical protein IPQ03_04530 [Bacteroidetes bacterium]|nr:hypothetical protein [Bacteroidota bacterium]
MRQFYIKSIVFIGIVSLSIFLVGIRLEKRDPADYLAAIIDKHHRLDSIHGPRLIFVGGSNLAFGIDSKLVESELKMPVVNLGLHAGLGLEFILKEISSQMKSGDEVVISLEYYLSEKGEYDLKVKAAEYYPPAKDYFESNIMGNIRYAVDRKRSAAIENLSALKKLVFAKSNIAKTPNQNPNVYERNCFNAYGDVECHKNQNSSIRADDIDPIKYKEYEGISMLNDFYKLAKEKDIHIYFMYPNFPVSVFNLNKEVIKRYQQDVSEKLLIPVLNTPEDFLYNDSLFFDTVYHLNGKGREIRTKAFIDFYRKGLGARDEGRKPELLGESD